MRQCGAWRTERARKNGVRPAALRGLVDRRDRTSARNRNQRHETQYFSCGSKAPPESGAASEPSKMNHISENQLVLFYYGESAEASAIEDHLSGCESCRSELRALQLVLNTID